MRVLHTIQSLSKTAAGLFYFLNDLTRYQQKAGHEVIVLGLEDEEGVADAHHWWHVRMELVRVMGPRFIPLSRDYGKTLSRLKPDIIHCHGLWAYHSLAVSSYCKNTGTPFIVSAHGMLEPWAWHHRAWKKRPVWWLWERNFLNQASALHATADQEAANLKLLALKNPTAIIGAGVDLPARSGSQPRSNEKRKTALFISRIHPKKGLLDLVKAWNLARPTGWRVVIAGPDSGGHLAVVRQAVHDLGLASSFEFHGPVYDSAKWALYQSADLFILPTHSENFGIVIAEALGSGLPVITTRGTPWQELESHGCGWWVEIGLEPLAAALKEATALSETRRQEMGERGRRLVEKNYSWPRIAQEMQSVYEWILRQGPLPSCVRP